MIVARLQGGLGNQLFQYAAGKSLATRLGTTLILDDTLLIRRRNDITPRNYELGVYKLSVALLKQKEREQVLFRTSRLGRFLCGSGIWRSNFTYFRESNPNYNSSFEKLVGDVILQGFWQSEKYFSWMAEDIRKELHEFVSVDASANVLLEQMTSCNSVSIHVRRGDYITNASAAEYHVVHGLAYYRRAVTLIAERVSNPVFFAFSDDPVWLKNELAIDYPLVIVSTETSRLASEELYLMSRCAHHITANSSFSWWGAWLNPSPDKFVIAPTKWFHASIDTTDLLPKDWLTC
ncbi:alpha-1,2-fucosyltransferase [Geobacter argillaceus]|uniref:Glycosyl transferase family 11 n=1 Tax=Geobacter argillaceus TaxID=345631 RepID=A0A562W822_9BACT|nr:alpha-1,2-fucosyltransferase [Geobacter argillaceus]TWJ26352.1 glycosyl transferase family 11 [Geobacter argillaceus]